MATAEADLSTKALNRCGIKVKIQSFDTDKGEEADACRLFFHDARKRLLGKAPWPFAARRAALAQKTGEDRTGFGYIYGWPDDCVKPRYVYPAGANFMPPPPLYPGQPMYGPMGVTMPRADQRYPFVVEASLISSAKVICCDLPPAVMLAYTYDLKDFDAATQSFRDAFTFELACDLCMVLTVKDNRVKYVEQKAPAVFAEAWTDSLSGMQEDRLPDSESVTVRY